MSGAVIAVADQVILQDLRSRLDQSEIKLDVVFVAESTAELTRGVISHQPTLLFVHDQLGPGLVTQTVRDLTLRNPALAVIMITATPSVAAYSAAMESGARAVLSYPFGLEDLENRLTSVVEWGQTVRRAVIARDSAVAGQGTGARVLTVTGAKGGVGATVVASHLAWDIATRERDLRVCLVDLDVEKGDVPSYLDVSHRVSIADLAKISEDLSPRAVADTIVVHTSGLHLLLAPTEIRDTDPVTAEAVRRIVAQLRGLYHLVIIDAGAAVTTTQAAAVESADITLQLVTADVPALRAARRQVTFWESLSVGNPDRTFVVVNRFDRSSEIQQDTIDQLVLGRRSEILVPDLGRGLERAGNSRTPAEARNQSWWKSLRAISQELGLVPAAAGAGHRERTKSRGSQRDRKAGRTAAAELMPLAAGPVTGRPNAGDGAVPTGPANHNGSHPPQNSPHQNDPQQNGELTAGEAGRRGRWWNESGQISLETAALFPFALLVLALCLQLVLLGVAFVWSGVAGDAAARAVSLGQSPQAAVNKRLPAGLHGQVISADQDHVTVRVSSPLLIGNGVKSEVDVDTNHTVVREPR